MLCRKTIEFVLTRQKDDGGFGATPHLPSTVEDTYYGLSLLDMLKPASDRKEEISERIGMSIQYLEGLRPRANWNPKTFYYYLLGRDIIGLDTTSEILNYFRYIENDKEETLEDFYYLCKAKEQVGLGPPDLKKLDEDKVDFSRWRTAKELWLKLCVADLCRNNTTPDRESLISWVIQCQNPDGGFGFYPGTTSFIENCHICLMILKILNAAPANPIAVRDFILRCRTVRGGFARKNGGAPFLDATWHAISSLKLLEPLLKGT